MNYLKYIEHAAENLQFWLWYRDYAKRFSELPPTEKCLAPEWTMEQAEAEIVPNGNPPPAPKKLSPETAAMLAGTAFALSKSSRRGNPFDTPPRTPMGAPEKPDPRQVAHDADTSDDDVNSVHAKAAGAFEKADLKWQPCKVGSYGTGEVGANAGQLPSNRFGKKSVGSSPSTWRTVPPGS